ncbi:hypothetical protein GGR53DRAFT_469613 [Hypoxylon sp. FL1150]|nr:hypothetical protein GGR53DRAFT_469613 [Hypoxylon sp. FL1150]
MDEKRAWLMNDLKFDAALNYKSQSVKEEELAAATPHRHWRAQLQRQADNVRVRNLHYAIAQRATLKGLIIFDHMAESPRVREEISRKIEGKLKSRMTMVRGGLKADEAGLVIKYDGVLQERHY